MIPRGPIRAAGLIFALCIPASCAPPEPVLPPGVPLELRAGELGTRLGPRFLPSALSVPLTATEDGDRLEGFLHLGPKLEATEPGFPLVLGRAGGADAWEVLFVESLAGGGSPSRRVEPTAGHLGEQPIFRLDLEVPHLAGGGRREEPYVVEIVVPRAGEEAPPRLLTAYGFSTRLARAEVNGADLTVLLSDGNSDGIFGLQDPWLVLEDAGLLAAPFTAQEAREVGDYAWAAGRAWKLVLEGTAGRRGRLIAHEPGMSEEEDRARRELYPEDRAAPRAVHPLPCLPAASPGEAAEGSGEAAPRLLLFGAPSCRPCRSMDRLVLTAEKVVEAGEGVLCRRIDVTEDPAALQRHGLEGVPAAVVLDRSGEEVARFEGYAGASAMASLLRRASR